MRLSKNVCSRCSRCTAFACLPLCIARLLCESLRHKNTTPYTTSAAAMTNGLLRCSSIQSSKGIPITAAGIQATIIFAHKVQMELRCALVSVKANGLSSLKKDTHTAKMAPSCITTKNICQKAGDTSRTTNFSSKSIWPVEEMGSHSVIPSTIPNSNAFKSSITAGMVLLILK